MRNLGWIITNVFCWIAVVGFTQVNFYRAYSSSNFDSGEGIVQLADSSFLLTGASSSFNTESGQAFILKTNQLGHRIWSRDFGGAESERGRRIFVNEAADAIYVAGISNSNGTGSYDFYFFKTDLQGSLLRENYYGGSRMESLTSAAMSNDKSKFILGGSTFSNATENENCMLVCIAENGDTLWTKQWGNDGVDQVASIKTITDSTFVVAGRISDPVTSITRGMLIYMKWDGTEIWNTELGDGVKNYYLKDVTFYQNHFSVCGAVAYLSGSTPKSNLLAARIGFNGVIQFENIDEFVQNSRFELLESYGNVEQYALIEQALSSTFSVFPDGFEDNIINKYSEVLFWSAPILNYSYVGEDLYNQLIKTNDGGLAVVGKNSSYGLGESNVVLIKIGPNGEAPASIQPQLEDLVKTNLAEAQLTTKVFPNPSTGIVSIITDFSVKKIALYDLVGKCVLEMNGIFEHSMVMDASSLAVGHYQLILQSESNDVVVQQLVIKQ